MLNKDTRQKSRRVTERRSKERRKVLFEFGSAEWRNIIQQEYLLWPKNDRRHSDRRTVGRRSMLRRVKNGVSPQKNVKANDLSALLTSEERAMINELIRSDDED